jgi:LacI family transcriptional regulator
MKRTKLTIRDIAHLAGVSHTTVSRALNNDPRVLPETVKKVLAVVEAKKYRPDPLARRFAQGKSHLIGLIVSDIKNPFYAEMARGIEDQARKLGYLVIMCSTDDQAEVLTRYTETVISAGVEGLIFASVRLHESVVRNLIDEKFPVVMVNRRLKAEVGEYVVLDNRKGAYQLTQHLIESGYRNIDIIIGPDDMSTAVERLRGYKQAMKENRMPLKKRSVHHVNFSRKDGFEAALRILKRKNRPDAIFGGNDYIAMGIIDAARQLALRIPQDLAVVGFDETEFAQSMCLTTVSQRKYEMGDLAVQILTQSIEQKTPGTTHRVVLEPQLIVRQSSRSLNGRKPDIMNLI